MFCNLAWGIAPDRMHAFAGHSRRTHERPACARRAAHGATHDAALCILNKTLSQPLTYLLSQGEGTHSLPSRVTWPPIPTSRPCASSARAAATPASKTLS